jgi:hypothetical protein
MNPAKLKMQHTIHLEAKARHSPRPYPALPSFATYRFYTEILATDFRKNKSNGLIQPMNNNTNAAIISASWIRSNLLSNVCTF